MIAIAMGVVGMSLGDFYELSPSQFSLVLEQHTKAHYRDSWERTRFLACCALSPYSKKAMKPKDVVSFAWDNEPERRAPEREKKNAPRSTRERFEEIVKRCEKST